MAIQFKDEAHRQFFFESLEKFEVSLGDTERTSLFYVLGLMEETRTNIHLIYNQKGACICPKALHEPFQTSGTVALTRLAFTLYNDFTERIPCLLEDTSLYEATFTGDDENPYLYEDNSYTHFIQGSPYFYKDKNVSVLDIFCSVDRDYVPYLFEAIKLRLNMISLK